jgi:hypothetical protein
MGLLDAAIGDALGAYGSKPQVPGFTPIDTQASAATAIGANLNNQPGAQQLASSTNAFNQSQLLTMLRSAIPGYDSIVSKVGGNISSELSGQLPQDVQDQIQRNAAAKSIGGGYSGSGMQGSLTARDLGLTSLQLTQQGMDSASRWITTQKGTAVPGQFDISSMFISPSQQIGVDQYNTAGAFQNQWLKNQISAMPDPTAAAYAKGASQDLGAFSSAMGSASAGGGGGGM